MPKWLKTLLEYHRAGIGKQPWIKYADCSFDTRTMSFYAITLRGYGWETSAHIGQGNIRKLIMEAVKKRCELGKSSAPSDG